MDLVSVIVPVYHIQEQYLRKCIESILCQEYENIELILVDDGALNNEGAVCDEYKKIDKRVSVIHQENQGVSAARNNGMQVAEGKWICFVDADDWIEKDMIKEVFNKISVQDTDMVVWNLYYSYPEHEVIRKNYPRTIYVKESDKLKEAELFLLRTIAVKKNELKIPTLSQPVCHLYKKRLIEEFHIRFSSDFKQGEDKLFNYEYFKHIGNFIYINLPLYHYRIHSESTTQSFFVDHVDTSTRILKKYAEIDSRIQTETDFRNTYDIRVLYIAWMLIGRYYLKTDASLKSLVNDFSKLMNSDPYKEAAKSVNLSVMDFSMTKVRLFLLRHKMYYLLFLDVRRENKIK
jgi:glycosyltransferase involved in cell wall biosynthesis